MRCDPFFCVCMDGASALLLSFFLEGGWRIGSIWWTGDESTRRATNYNVNIICYNDDDDNLGTQDRLTRQWLLLHRVWCDGCGKPCTTYRPVLTMYVTIPNSQPNHNLFIYFYYYHPSSIDQNSIKQVSGVE